MNLAEKIIFFILIISVQLVCGRESNAVCLWSCVCGRVSVVMCPWSCVRGHVSVVMCL